MKTIPAVAALLLLIIPGPGAARAENLADFLYLKLGGMRPGSGIGGGVELRNDHLANGKFDLRVESKVSIRLYQQHELELIDPHLFSSRFYLELLAVYRSYTQVDYFGIGPESREEDHSDYRVDGLAMFANFGFRPARGVQIGLRGGYLQTKPGQGTDDDLPPPDANFRPEDLPGWKDAPSHVLVGGFFAWDLRDDADEPSSGGYYELQSTHYEDTESNRYAFHDLEYTLQQFVALGRRYTLAFRVNGIFTGSRAGQEVPFYLLPTLGGTDSLRSFENDRFRDRHMVLLNNELRYRATPAIRIILFVDAGEVFPRIDAFRFRGLQLSYGAAVGYRFADALFLGLSAGFGREGGRLSFKGDLRF